MGMPYPFNALQTVLAASMPSDSGLVDLIEQAFLEGQIDGKRADLAYLWLSARKEPFIV